MNKPEISKSQFLKGVQCQKALWIYRNAKELHPIIPESKQAIFDTGHEIGILAQKAFKGGVEVEADYWDIQGAVKKTEAFIESGNTIIFEAAAINPQGIYSRIDALKKVKGKDEWDLIEVKGSTEVKDYYYWDMAAQRYAFLGAGYRIRKSVLMHINNKYVRNGALDLDEYFIQEDCTEAVKERMKEVKKLTPEFLATLK